MVYRKYLTSKSTFSNKDVFNNFTKNFGANWTEDGDDIIIFPVYDVNGTAIFNETTLEDGFLKVSNL